MVGHWWGVGFVGHAIVDYVTLGVVNVGESIVAGVVLGLLAGLNEWRDSHEE